MKPMVLMLFALYLLGCSDDVEHSTGPAADTGAVRVLVTRAQQRPIEHVLTALGSVESIHHPTISAETSGQIIGIEVQEGDPVEPRQLLANIDNTLHRIEAEKAAAELQRQEVLLENQRREVNRLLQLARSQSISRDRLEDEQAQLEMLTALRNVASKQTEQAQYLASKTRILAPRAGRVTQRHISIGDYVTPGQPLFQVVATDKLRARLAFPEHHAANISLGQQVRLKSPASQARAALGSVTSINPQINPRSRAIDIIVEFDNPGGWYPGGSVDATLVVEEKQDAPTLPTLSVVRRGEQNVVFVVEGERAVQRPVELGWQEGDWVEIVSGLAAQDLVVTEGAALISEGSRLVITAEESIP